MRGGSERKCLGVSLAVMSTCRLYLNYGCIRIPTMYGVVVCGLERNRSVVMDVLSKSRRVEWTTLLGSLDLGVH